MRVGPSFEGQCPYKKRKTERDFVLSPHVFTKERLCEHKEGPGTESSMN